MSGRVSPGASVATNTKMNDRAERLRLLKQLISYGTIGLLSNLAGYLVYLGLTTLGTTPKATMTVLYAVGATLSFLANRKLTFSHEGSLLGAAGRYVLAHLAGYAINFALLWGFVDRLGYPHQWVQAIAIFVVAAFLFVVMRLFVFRPAA